MNRRFALGVALILSMAGSAGAQNWPAKPVTMIVPFAAGTTSDVIGRSLAEYLSEKIGQNVVIDNRGGAGGNIGALAVAKAAPDGYTLLLATTGPAATNKLMYKSLGFDPQSDFAPIALIGKSPVIIVAKMEGQVKSLRDLIDAAKAKPETLSAGYPGNGTLGHITGLLLQDRAGVKMNQAQYRGSSQIMTDLLGGHIDVGMDSMSGYIPTIKDGKLRALAIGSSTRWPGLPDTPTVSEAGLPDFEATVWYALLAPKGAPADIVQRLNVVTNDYLKTDKAKALFADIGFQAAGGSPGDLKAFVDAEIAKWAPVIKGANISF
ncbi:tripartite tricarboxylate transporter substrate binding protein [Terrarubrum flagellatum]|uniref:Bug family tripartite tricarboxylate transporter substrate binding protein n=1 Tax=Terrirubrum flagellatum TaxID=2895980 RepID=UPI0031453D7D